MPLSAASRILIILYALVVLLIAQGNSARKIHVPNGKDRINEEHLIDHLQQHGMKDHLRLPINTSNQGSDNGGNGDDDNNHDDNADEDHDANGYMDPARNIFFTVKDLFVGKTMPIYFPKNEPSTSPRLLPREEADSIPFLFSKLAYLLEFFSFTPDSPQAKVIEYTLTQCELEPTKGETRFCATSLESMLDFAAGIFGLDTKFKVLTTTHLSNSTTLLQNYTFLETPGEILAPKIIACHTLPYPYAVYYCHCQESENRLYQVLLGGENGEKVEAVAICHFDTSQWDRSHVAFQVLGIEPGSSPVCHFFPADNLVWVPLPA